MGTRDKWSLRTYQYSVTPKITGKSLFELYLYLEKRKDFYFIYVYTMCVVVPG